MLSADLILTVVALVLFALAALQVPVTRVNLGWAGLFFYVLTAVV